MAGPADLREGRSRVLRGILSGGLEEGRKFAAGQDIYSIEKKGFQIGGKLVKSKERGGGTLGSFKGDKKQEREAWRKW